MVILFEFLATSVGKFLVLKIRILTQTPMMFLRQWKGDSQGDFGVVNGILEQKIQQQREKKASSPTC